MNTKTLHPNTQTLLSAWERMRAAPDQTGHGPSTDQHADLIEYLFVIELSDDGVWAFRNAGDQMSTLLGRELGDHDYLDFWTGHDREMLAAFLHAVHESRQPGIVKARGETLNGQRIDIEMTLAPLTSLRPGRQSARILGLYQTLGATKLLAGRPIWRHRLTAVFPPDIQPDPPRLRLVASND